MISDSQLDQMVLLLNAAWFERSEKMNSFNAESGGIVYDFYFDSERNLLLIVTGKGQFGRLRVQAHVKFDQVEFITTNEGTVRQLFLESTPEGNMVRMVLSYHDELEINFTNAPSAWPPDGPVQFN